MMKMSDKLSSSDRQTFMRAELGPLFTYFEFKIDEVKCKKCNEEGKIASFFAPEVVRRHLTLYHSL